MGKTTLLFLIILCEGYIVLACELLAIRQLIPFVGSGTECIAIIISGVLLPLAVGYHAGGNAFNRAYARARRRGKTTSIRIILGNNILIALTVLSLGLSYLLLELFFRLLDAHGITNKLAQTVLYALLFLVTPIFMLGQTVPLVSNYFSPHKLSAITGRMLFFSTSGSFLGSIFSTVVLMSTIGVHYTVIVTLGLLFFLAVVVCTRQQTTQLIMCFFIFLFACRINIFHESAHFKIVSDNAYNIVGVEYVPQEGTRQLMINRAESSVVSDNPERRFKYEEYIDRNFIGTLADDGNVVHDVLVLGAGGFTVGLRDRVNNYTFVDIDKALKNVAEKDFLLQKLTPNKQFVPSSARAFVRSDTKKYDLIVLDTYTNTDAIPMETTTREYLLDIKRLLKDDGVLVANIVSSATFRDRFSVRYDNTFSSVFPRHSRQLVWPLEYAPTKKSISNMLYIYFNNKFVGDNSLYTDDKNTYSMDIK